MSKLGDKLREHAAICDRDENIRGVGIIIVDTYNICAGVPQPFTGDDERDAMLLGLSLYQATNMKTYKTATMHEQGVEVE